MERKSGKNFRVGYRFSSFLEILEMLFHSLLKVAENSNQTFWLNGKCPLIAIDFSNL